jgi:hypothetical protein
MSEFIREEQARRRREDLRRKDTMREDLEFRAGDVPSRTDSRDELDRRTTKTTSPSSRARFQAASRASVDRLAEIVNDPDVIVDAKMMRTINDPNMVMLSTGEVARLEPRSRQFAAENVLPRKTKRKKNPKLARAMKEANARGRKKNGGFKKGYDQARIARLAQKILKRMK